MRGSLKSIAVAGAVGALLCTGLTSVPLGRANSSQVDQLQAQRAQLLSQLAALTPSRTSAGSALGAAESAFMAAQSRVNSARNNLQALNERMVYLSQQQTADEATVAAARHQLGELTRATYETADSNSVMVAIVSASSFDQAMERLHGEATVAGDVHTLLDQITTKEQAIRDEKSELAREQSNALGAENQLSQESNLLLSTVAARDAAFNAVNGPARALETQIANIDQQIASLESPIRTGVAGGSCGNHFAFGYCTWYVATRRCVPWFGNAKDWYVNAAAMGYQVGHRPEVGAAVVFPPGGDGASGWGHVGYVEAVGPTDGVPAGYFKLSEMNFTAGWDRVDYRVLPSDSPGITGFVYGR